MSRRRHLLARAGAVLLAVVVLVVTPGYLASRPGFFARYPSLAEQYDPWSTSTHRDAACGSCHVRPGILPRTAYRARLVGEFYLSLISRTRTPKLFATPTNEACLACHSDLRTVSPQGDIQIPHRAHVSILKMRCVQCHDFLVHELNANGNHNPPMSGCLTCHNGDRAKNTCTACHTEKAPPASHIASDWPVAHAKHATDSTCPTCHKWTPDWCAECHSHRPKSHTAKWRATHGAAVAKHRSCEACHEPPFCVRCHGEWPANNANPTLKLVK